MRLIDADALDFTIPDNPHFMTATLVQVVKNAIDKAPTIEAEPVRHGRWRLADDGDGVVCSCCGKDFCNLIYETDDFHYCFNCGAKMDGGAADADSV